MTNITWKQTSRPLRLLIAAPSCVLAAFVTLALAGGVELRLDADHKPVIDVSLTSAHWTGTLDAARLPARVPLLSTPDNGLTVQGKLAAVNGIIVYGSGLNACASPDDSPFQIADTQGNVYASSVTATRAISAGGADFGVYADSGGYYVVAYGGTLQVVDAYGNLCSGGNLGLPGSIIEPSSGHVVFASSLGPILYASNGAAWRLVVTESGGLTTEAY